MGARSFVGVLRVLASWRRAWSGVGPGTEAIESAGIGDNATAVLEGLAVLDLSPTRVGAQISQVLADHGADVVWVEPPGGSALRRDAAFPCWARGKQSVELDLRSTQGQRVARELAARADVLIETFRPGVAERLGLGFDALHRVNPRLVYASVTGFGRLGPYAGVKGYEGIVQAKLGAFASFRKITSSPRPPFVTVAYASFAASQVALHGVLAALLERERSGLGQHVEASLAHAYNALDAWNWFVYLVTRRWPEAFLPNDPYDADGVPMGAFPYLLLVGLTSDGRWLQFAQTAPRLFAALMRALGLDWMFADPDWEGLPVFDDQARRAELWHRMLAATNAKTLAEWEKIFEADPDVFAERFRRGPEVLEHPQLVHDGHVVVADDPERGPVRQPGLLVHVDGRPDPRPRPAPRLGEHRPGLLTGREPPARTTPADAPRDLPLAGVTILELAALFAAPYGSTLLADLGARVIHVEPLEGDPIRTMMPFPECAGVKVMQGKESICLDLSTPEGLAIVHDLAMRADVVVQGYRAGVAARLGIDAATLRALNPDLVYVNAVGYGTGGPYGRRPAYAPSIGAAGGIARANLGDSVPEHSGMTLSEIQDGARRMFAAAAGANATADGFAALGVATAILVGLLGRARGAPVEPLLTTMLSTVAHAMSSHTVHFPGSPGAPTADPELAGFGARYRIYDTPDGQVFLAVPSERDFNALARALSPYVDLVGDPRFATEADRRANDAALAEVLAGVFAARSKDAWEHDLLAADVACVAVTTAPIEAMMLSDEFGRASGYVVDVVHPTFDEHPRLAPFVRFSRSATQARPGCLAGAHTERILAELGYDDDARAALAARGVVR